MEKTKQTKIREEHRRCLEKIAALQKRAKELERKLAESESLEIRALMKDENVTLDELTALVRSMQQRREARRYASDEEREAPHGSPAYAATFDDWEDENE